MKNLRQGNVPFESFFDKWNVPVLNDNEVHVWFAEFELAQKLVRNFRSFLSTDELSKSEFFLEMRLQNNYVICHGVMRKLLSVYSGIESEKLSIIQTDNAKPYLKEQHINFNLTHSGNKFGIAFSKSFEVGLDVEMIRNLHDFDQMITVNFTPSEQKYIDRTNLGFENRFFEMWTLKESYLKLTGEGMSRNPASLDFRMDKESPQLNSVDHVLSSNQKQFVFVDVGRGYKSTLAISGIPEIIDIKIIS